MNPKDMTDEALEAELALNVRLFLAHLPIDYERDIELALELDRRRAMEHDTQQS